MGFHSSQEDTLEKIKTLFWWPQMKSDVITHCKFCQICHIAKPKPVMTAETRTALHQRPFRVLFMDTVGPNKPTSDGFSYLGHVECPFSRYCWIKPMVTNDADEWAKFLVEDVFFDVAGFPAVLRSDRGPEFTNLVIDAVNKQLKIKHTFGAAFHPQSQGYIEGRHKTINNVLKAYVGRQGKHKDQWATFSKLAQWSMRSTPRKDRGNKSPYEIVTGLKPQGPLDAVFAKFNQDG